MRQPPAVHRLDPASGGIRVVADDFAGPDDKVRPPYRVSNVAFGGPHRNRLFIAASNASHAVFPNVRGAPFPAGSPA